ncbi:hypothetical protein NEOLEDRAFT_498655 [Neolentinus lepideus HHB14362 ss-1]|uniref:DUF6535 domain-containing protein n=1 Tax=Neolentinus lepideus HHB14362 ss-1 TaxID=1314782 RepID=A0A165RP43_9AGAM|nr:hypothetical protein NEOLEDRAFT_498655 [Neolentinus lepideus HHB14362 ss-1]
MLLKRLHNDKGQGDAYKALERVSTVKGPSSYLPASMSRQGAPARAAPLQDTQASLSALQSEYSQSFSNEQPPAGDRDCWSQCLDRVKTHDEDMIKKYQEDMDALLVFAGVFSAVLTPFNIEAYKMLGPTPAEKGNELLQGILQQMSNFTVNNNYINTTSPYMPLSDQFRPPLSAIVINCTWFASLVCSLAAASLAILIKQWLHAYIDWPGKSPRASLHLRQLRFEGLQKWGCHQFINSLSILLEAALVLFFIGLWVFVRTLHPTVTVLITTLLLSYGSVLVSTTILPAIYTGCPYKSPLAFVLYTGLQHVLNHTIVYWKFFLRRTRIGLYIFFDFKVPLSDEHFHEESISPDDWAKRERASIRVTVQREKEISLLAWADKQFADDRFLRTVIIPCLLHMPKTSAELCASSILKDRLPSLKSPLGTRPHTKRNPSFALLQSLWNERISNERNTDTQNLAKSLVGRVTRLSASEANVLRRYLNQICSVLLDSKTSDVERRQAFSNLANLLIPAPTTVFSELIKRKCYRLASELRRREAPQDVPAFDLLDPATCIGQLRRKSPSS